MTGRLCGSWSHPWLQIEVLGCFELKLLGPALDHLSQARVGGAPTQNLLGLQRAARIGNH